MFFFPIDTILRIINSVTNVNTYTNNSNLSPNDRNARGEC